MGWPTKEEREALEHSDFLFLYANGVTEAMSIEHLNFPKTDQRIC